MADFLTTSLEKIATYGGASLLVIEPAEERLEGTVKLR